MNEFQLKYGCNPNQKPSRIFMADGSELPVEILRQTGIYQFLRCFQRLAACKGIKRSNRTACGNLF